MQICRRNWRGCGMFPIHCYPSARDSVLSRTPHRVRWYSGVLRMKLFKLLLLAIAPLCASAATLAPSSTWFYQAQYMDVGDMRSEEHTSELQSLRHLVCRLLLEKK